MLKMRDVSGWNGAPNFESQEFAHDHIIAVKATEGTGYLSPVFRDDWESVKRAGKARIAYHFFHPSLSGVNQAHYFLDIVRNAGLETGDMLALDTEQTDGQLPSTVAQQSLAFRQIVEQETKCKLIVYTFIDFALTGNCDGLSDSPLWIADPDSPPGNPRVPAPWNNWEFHQYGVSKGMELDIAKADSLEHLLPFGCLIGAPIVQPTQRVLWVSDGETEKEVLVAKDSISAGFTLQAGKAVFKVLA
jgi:GH25 family lysozyme M1 (1,4-beta-N-acetylmuramidase)